MTLSVTVLSPDFTPIGLVNKLTALQWSNKSPLTGEFKLWAPLTKENASLLQEDNLIWLGGDDAGVIETILQQKDSDGGKSIEVSGRFLLSWLSRRVIWNRYANTGVVSSLLVDLVRDNAASPSIPERAVPHTTLASNQQLFGPSVSVSFHRQNLLDTLEDFSGSHNLSCRLKADVRNQRAVFEVRKATDRSIEQSLVPSVVLSTELSDIMESEYTLDSSNYNNTALVAGAGEEEARKTSVVNPQLAGLDRREYYVDARDLSDTAQALVKITTTTFILGETAEVTTKRVYTDPNTGLEVTKQSTETKPSTGLEPGIVYTEANEQVPIDQTVYERMLQERGLSSLETRKKTLEFEASVRVLGATAYTYGKDYFIGDRITVQDKELGVQISTEITESQESWDESEYSLTLTLGTAAPTITRLVKRGK